ncbi:SDR family oxidoreductase [Gemmobacter fulvus]|uniref:SDR family oxidoreductase n=1 Tax=Gemmobacter fulvus TaxID=2840474 RepID=A0A975P4K6_9RHOB|nr:SDR family oxidoreductase [Gemmobacter fulvus]MBT9246967.1 SDR family oxidoreductase [Gemmobacter fulvus]QWK89740.1 SDR family oxidoreductase [Gemmobacter fulvus]
MRDHAETVAVITGGSQGLGLAIAERLLAEGCGRMILAGRGVAKGEAVAAQLRAGGADVRFLPADMGRPDEAIALIDRAASRFGRVTALVNAAAATDRGSILDTTPEAWDNLMAVNARGPFFALQRFAQLAAQHGHPAQAVNILSMVVHCGQSFLAPYSASKAALANVTRNAAQALRGHRIRVNAINCGWMDTPGEDETQRKYHGATDGWLAAAEAAQPMGMLVKPAHVAGLASFMLSPASGVMTGAVVDFDQNVSGAYPE